MEIAVFIASILVGAVTLFLNKRSTESGNGFFAELFSKAKSSLPTFGRKQNIAVSPEEAKIKSKYKSLNILLYIGSFIFISSLTAYLSSVDTMLVPPAVITITLLAALSSLLMFKFVNFLKPAAFAFNISALIMFLFWWPSLDALDLNITYSGLIIYSTITIVSLISAIIFNDPKYWHCVFAFFGLLIVSLIDVLGELINSRTNSIPTLICMLVFSLLASILICLWKGHARFVPQSMRLSVKNYAFIYQLVTIASIPYALATSHFASTVAVLFLILNYLLSKFVPKEKVSIPVLRALAQFAVIIFTIDLVDTLKLNYDMTIPVSIVVLASSLLQCIISMVILAVKSDNHTRNLERSIICFSTIASSFVAYKYFNLYDYYGNYSAINGILGGIGITLCSLICIGMFLFDKSCLWLIPAALFVPSFFGTIETNSGLLPIITIAFSVLCFLAPFIYFAGHKKDELEANIGAFGLLVALCFSNILIQSSSYPQTFVCAIPTLIGLVSLLVLSLITNNIQHVKMMLYQLALSLMHVSRIFDSSLESLSFLAAEAFPIALLGHGTINTFSKKETNPNSILITAYILFELVYFPYMVETAYGSASFAIVAVLGTLINLLVLAIAAVKRWKAFEIFAIISIVLQLLSITNGSIALWFIIIGLSIIVGVIIGFYRIAHKDDGGTPQLPQQ